jgi:hypothetical protein
MNQLFSLSRWLLLVSRHWSEHRKRYLLSLLAIFGLLTGFYSFVILAGHRPIPLHMQSLFYYFGLYFIGCLYASTLFDDLNTAPRGISFLLLPASTLEKLLCNILFGIIIFFIAYTVVFYLVDYGMVNLSNTVSKNWQDYPLQNAELFQPAKIANVFSNKDEMKVVPIPLNLNNYFLMTYFAAQASFILGSIYFSKFGFVKTIICLFGLFFFIFIYFGIILSHLLPDGWFYDTFTSWRRNDPNGPAYAFLPAWAEESFYFLLKFCFPFIILVIAYFRLKEKEI